MRRVIATITLFVLLGAIVNVAVAWGLAVHYHIHKTPPVVFAYVPEPGWLPDVIVHTYPGIGTAVERVCIGVRERVVLYSTADVVGFDSMLEVGVPFYALSVRDGFVSTQPRIEPKAITFTTDLYGNILVPYEHGWLGAISNITFYGLLLWLIFVGPFALRRTIRRRRGCCIACGYPVGVSPRCTECGTAVALLRKPNEQNGSAATQAVSDSQDRDGDQYRGTVGSISTDH